ncbi:hypothetical protein TWF679_007937 [Orbilia oligospora]|uniref:DUF914-domain-containing protein n=1 Tax=Orbilia oligospora TaxID=2813651 RepID=A0A8H8V662_ORBOL|nr:hypothetical protein TWF679_007937 [Orbilia oligospora]
MVAAAAASTESPIGVVTANSVDDPAVRVDSKSPTIIAPEAIADDSSEGTQKKSLFGFYTSKRFWITLVIGQFLALYFILAFFDVEGNYFVVLAYRYTTILSAELINFWAIVVVVILSFFLLRVRYHWSQIVGILVCCAGMGVLIGSDKLQGGDFHSGADVLKGDLFMLLGATFYGFSNVTEEFFVSKTPLYVVIGQLGFWGMCINGVQAAIFDRTSIANAVWDGKVAGYLVGYNLVLFIFYTVTPVLFRLSSAAFFNISLLTANFWGLIIGIRVFGYKVHYLYPVAFVLIMVGLIVYYIMDASGIGDDSVKPWLGENQEGGHEGIGTAKRRMRTRVGRGVGAGADP